MLAFIVIVLLIMVASAIFLYFEGRNAPLGYQDKDGLHYGEPPRAKGL